MECSVIVNNVMFAGKAPTDKPEMKHVKKDGKASLVVIATFSIFTAALIPPAAVLMYVYVKRSRMQVERRKCQAIERRKIIYSLLYFNPPSAMPMLYFQALA